MNKLFSYYRTKRLRIVLVCTCAGLRVPMNMLIKFFNYLEIKEITTDTTYYGYTSSYQIK